MRVRAHACTQKKCKCFLAIDNNIHAQFNILGAGSIVANGGKGAYAMHGGGGGGGGRIMLNYTSIDQLLIITAKGGKGGCLSVVDKLKKQQQANDNDDEDDDDGRGQDGTIYKPCPMNQYSEGGKLPCAPCSHGKIWKNYICTMCPSGTMYIPLYFINSCVPSLYLVMLPCFALTFVCFVLMAVSQAMRMCCRRLYSCCCCVNSNSVAASRSSMLESETNSLLANPATTYYSGNSANRVVKPTAMNHTLKSQDVEVGTLVTNTGPHDEALLCDICFVHQKDTALNCGHVMCEACSEQLYKCPYCKTDITSVMKVYL